MKEYTIEEQALWKLHTAGFEIFQYIPWKVKGETSEIKKWSAGVWKNYKSFSDSSDGEYNEEIWKLICNPKVVLVR